MYEMSSFPPRLQSPELYDFILRLHTQNKQKTCQMQRQNNSL